MTAWVSDDRSSEAYERLTQHLGDGRQAYVVCPLIEASETTVARAAEDEAERLRRAELKGFRVGCLHGRLKPAERRAIMARVQGRRARRARRDDGDRGRRGRAERDDHDRAGGRPLRARAAAPAARTGRARRRAVVLPARLGSEGGADGRRAASGSRRWSRRPTGSSSPSATSRSVARASCSAPASRASPTCASRGCARTGAARARARGAAAALPAEGLLARRGRDGCSTPSHLGAS